MRRVSLLAFAKLAIKKSSSVINTEQVLVEANISFAFNRT